MDPDAYLEMAEVESCHWWFRGRRKIISHVLGALHLPPRARILEIGSGTGGNLDMLSAYGEVHALEMSEPARLISIRKTYGRFDIRLGSCPADIPFVGEKFDLICLFDVLEHINEDVETLKSLRAILAEDGKILMTVPAYSWLWSAHDQFLHHKRRYSAKRLKYKIWCSGFRITKISYFNTFLFPLAAAARMLDKLSGSFTARGTRVPFEPVNSLFAQIFGAERHLLARGSLPFGVSLLCVLRV